MQKKDVIAVVHEQLGKRLTDLLDQFTDIEQARNNETKSSAGDKYETAREMMQREADQIEERIQHVRDLLGTLQRINTDTAHTRVQEGSLVQTNTGWFLLGVPVGKISVDADTCFALSLASPLGTQLLDKKAGDHFFFRNSEIIVLTIQ